MYRAVALWAFRQGVPFDDVHRMEQLAKAAAIELVPGRIHLNGEDVSEAIRTRKFRAVASEIAVIPGVRRAMVEEAEGNRRNDRDVVMEAGTSGRWYFEKPR